MPTSRHEPPTTIQSSAMDIVEITPALDTGIYASGEVLFITNELAGAVKLSGGQALLQSIAVIDDDSQAGAIDLVFMRSNVSLGTINLAVSMAEADADEILTMVSLTSADYKDLVNSKFAVKTNGDYGMGTILEPTTGTSLYIAGISRDSKTYTAAGLTIKIGLIR